MAYRQRSLSLPKDEGLYHFSNEHDACGVGMVANLSGVGSHELVLQGITILKRLLHRGAAGSDPLSGDGAGILSVIPDGFFRGVLGDVLPAAGQYAVGVLFGGAGEEAHLERIVEEEGLRLLCWRDVPVDLSQLGETARNSCPAIRQFFVCFPEGYGDRLSQDALERKAFVVRRRLEKELLDAYLPSFSSRTVVYKGLMLATQIEAFYKDLADARFASPLVLVHQRYSTNTFPTWRLAHPFRYLAHNGEINTLRGNLNHARTREAFLESPLFGEDLKKLLPLIDETQNDSACLDNMVELLVQSGRWLPHVMLMLIPQAWGANYHLGRDIRGFFDYHSALSEPWDGPAAVTFTDGIGAGAMLDRNGLRPARYSLTKDGLFVLASETGVLDLDPATVVCRGRLKPGEILWCDLQAHRLILNEELKNRVARQSPYRRWSQESKIPVTGLFDSIAAEHGTGNLKERQRLFGWSQEDVELLLRPMLETGKEPVGSMGNDAALAVLSPRPQLLFQYFKQRFAQVTNPPIDPIREQLVMSLTTYIGNQGNVLSEEAHRASLIRLARPVLTGEDLARLEAMEKSRVERLSIVWKDDLDAALSQLEERAVAAARAGKNILILSDREVPADQMPIPSLLAAAAVNQALSAAGLRPPVGVILETGEAREVMHFALLLGYGATAVHPYLALETVAALAWEQDPAKATENYISAIDKGLLKCMSKMGIATLRSYRSAQMFEAIGLGRELIRKYFPGTPSAVDGIGMKEVAQEVRQRVQEARAPLALLRSLPVGGAYRWRHDGEPHLVTPAAVCSLHAAVRQDDPERYRAFADATNHPETPIRLRDLLRFRTEGVSPLPLEKVESETAILKHFVSGAMSLGALSPEAHETIAVAMNSLGIMSNSGEGGEGPERSLPGPHGENRASAIRQVASGRFGVTAEYLARAKDLQIKMAQGAKPGEGGQLPGDKVNDEIARTRHSTAHVTLISPPPHHDIYSIEDLAQLIHDLRAVNPGARVSVKLVSENGVGTVAAGVAKAHADVVVISGHDGGTGAAPLSSMKYAGMPWEIGLAETHQTLVKNNLRGMVRLQVDGQLRTGRDVVVAALLGGEEFGFATALLLALGCMMLRQCQDNTCPAGITTQDPEIRKHFQGKPEHIVRYLHFIAREAREILASLGLHSLDEAVGRADLLEPDPGRMAGKAAGLDFHDMLHRAVGAQIRWDGRLHPQQTYDDQVLFPALGKALDSFAPAHANLAIVNANRSVGAHLSGRVALAKGLAGLPDDTWRVDFHGVAGQSFGAFLAHGITFRLTGEANDYVGKGLSGGRIVIVPDPASPCAPEENVLAGNVIGYGGTSGEIFVNGQVGERFAIRNSGFQAVVEGVGDHGCEYMTGGRVVVLGPTGVNFAAGMTGGLAYVLDQSGDFDLRCNLDTVDLETVREDSPEEAELLALLEKHRALTGSAMAGRILDQWKEYRGRFVCVMPVEYKKIFRSAR